MATDLPVIELHLEEKCTKCDHAMTSIGDDPGMSYMLKIFHYPRTLLNDLDGCRFIATYPRSEQRIIVPHRWWFLIGSARFRATMERAMEMINSGQGSEDRDEEEGQAVRDVYKVRGQVNDPLFRPGLITPEEFKKKIGLL